MSVFTREELRYLSTPGLLGRLATVGKDGVPHVIPVGWSFDPELGTFDIGGINPERTKKFRDVQRSGVAAMVIDDVLPPFSPRGLEVRGRAEVLDGDDPRIRIHPTHIVSWGLTDPAAGSRYSREVVDAG